jgi:hypothetical protein
MEHTEWWTNEKHGKVESGGFTVELNFPAWPHRVRFAAVERSLEVEFE